MVARCSFIHGEAVRRCIGLTPAPAPDAASRPAIVPNAHDRDDPHRALRVIERTLVLVKPDGVQRLLVGRILGRYEERGLKLVGMKLMTVDRSLAERHYAVHREKPFFKGLVDFITSGPLVAAVLEGPNAIAIVRAMNGATRPHEAAPGSIRGDFAVETAQNLVHASDSPETAATELALWFKPDELQDYSREIDRWVLAPEE
jgi:nucleoside-diphosphate kinase